MRTMGLCLLFFVVGAVEDFVVSCFYRSLQQKRALRTSLISVGHTFLAIFVVSAIIQGDSILLLTFYALGGGVGIFLGVKHG